MKSERTMFTAAIEAAKVFSHAVRESAQTAGVLEALKDPATVDDLSRRMGFHPGRKRQVTYMLRILSHEGYVSEREVGGELVFQRLPAPEATPRGPEEGRYQPEVGRVDDWYGEDYTEAIRNVNKDFLGPDLGYLRTTDVTVRFDRHWEWVWRNNLRNPIYEFGRLVCVRELVACGTRFLDLACGMGDGAQRLAEFSDEPVKILGIDKSGDFVSIARSGVYPDAEVTFLERDLNTGLPPLRAGSFDGVLFMGAFHFMLDKRARLLELWRVLRPGGILALGHCYSRSGFDDEQMHDFQFSLIEDPVWPIPWVELKDLATACGFDIYKEFHRGSHSYLLARRRFAAPDPLGGAAVA
jgi:SAM-dependent methyltransferase